MATITTRIDDKVKKELREFSNEIGIPVGALFNAWAKHLLRTREVTFKLGDDVLEDQEMYGNAKSLQQEGELSIASGHSSLVI